MINGGIMGMNERDVKGLISPLMRPTKNAVVISPNETGLHRELKWAVCKRLSDLRYDFYVEARLTNGKRPDIIIPKLSCCIEIQVSEKDESIEKKKGYYMGLRVFPVKSKEDINLVLGEWGI